MSKDIDLSSSVIVSNHSRKWRMQFSPLKQKVSSHPPFQPLPDWKCDDPGFACFYIGMVHPYSPPLLPLYWSAKSVVQQLLLAWLEVHHLGICVFSLASALEDWEPVVWSSDILFAAGRREGWAMKRAGSSRKVWCNGLGLMLVWQLKSHETRSFPGHLTNWSSEKLENLVGHFSKFPLRLKSNWRYERC